MTEILFTLKTFQDLSVTELYEILRLRQQIFVVEQNCPYQDADGKDLNGYHVLHLNEAYSIQEISHSESYKKQSLKINGKRVELLIKDDVDRLIDSMGYAISSTNKVNQISAPMPGLILDIMVTPGQSVVARQGLLILEAMKMENVIKASTDGIIKVVNLSIGQSVDKGQIIIELE